MYKLVVSMVSMVTSAPTLQGLLILPNEHCTYKAKSIPDYKFPSN